MFSESTRALRLPDRIRLSRLAQVTVPSGSGGSFVSSCTSWEALSAVPSCWLSAAIAGPVSVPAAITAASSRANVRLMG